MDKDFEQIADDVMKGVGLLPAREGPPEAMGQPLSMAGTR
jgi:hypothetical protein